MQSSNIALTETRPRPGFLLPAVAWYSKGGWTDAGVKRRPDIGCRMPRF